MNCGSVWGQAGILLHLGKEGTQQVMEDYLTRL